MKTPTAVLAKVGTSGRCGWWKRHIAFLMRRVDSSVKATSPGDKNLSKNPARDGKVAVPLPDCGCIELVTIEQDLTTKKFQENVPEKSNLRFIKVYNSL